MTSAEFWGAMIREQLAAGEIGHARDLRNWLDHTRSEDSEMFHDDLQTQEWNFHVFADKSIVDCGNGQVLTLEQAVAQLGDDWFTIQLLHDCIAGRPYTWRSEPEAVQ
jgi:hypothetical protein